jgi:predicted O-methyltransferase YrrM
VNEILQDILSTGKVQSVNGEKFDLVASITPGVGELLSSLIQQRKPKVSLEVGLAYGISALYICDALTKVGAKRHYIIDPNQSADWKGIGLLNLERAGYKGLIEFREKPSHVALPELLAEGVKVDFGFIDAYQVFDQAIVDFFYVDKILKIGGLMAFDDANWPSLRKALRFIVKNRKYQVVACDPSPFSKRDKLSQLLMPLTARLGGLLIKPEILEPDGSLGLVPGSRFVVLRKQGDDDRKIIHHRPF